MRAGPRAERQSEALSDSEGGGGSRAAPGGPSNLRRDPSRDEGASGRGPSLRQFPANFGSSSNPPPPKPDRSFSDRSSQQAKVKGIDPLLTRLSDANPDATSGETLHAINGNPRNPNCLTHRTGLRDGVLKSFKIGELDVAETLGFVLPILDDFDGLCLSEGYEDRDEFMTSAASRRLTCPLPKNSSSSTSEISKARLPMKAVYGGPVGRGRSSRPEGMRSALGQY